MVERIVTPMSDKPAIVLQAEEAAKRHPNMLLLYPSR